MQTDTAPLAGSATTLFPDSLTPTILPRRSGAQVDITENNHFGYAGRRRGQKPSPQRVAEEALVQAQARLMHVVETFEREQRRALEACLPAVVTQRDQEVFREVCVRQRGLRVAVTEEFRSAIRLLGETASELSGAPYAPTLFESIPA